MNSLEKNLKIKSLKRKGQQVKILQNFIWNDCDSRPLIGKTGLTNRYQSKFVDVKINGKEITFHEDELEVI